MTNHATTPEDILALARYEVEQAAGYESDELSAHRAKARDYYNGVMLAAPEGRSQLVSFDVADTIHALMAQLTRMFSTSNVEFTPEDERDEQGATAEGDAVEWFIKRAGGVAMLNTAAHDA